MTDFSKRSLSGAMVLALGCAVILYSADGDSPAPSASWPQFRGVNSSGLSRGASTPTEFGPGKNELWRLPIGLGHSSPCIAGDAIFATTWDPETKKLAVVCVDRTTGTIRWERTVPATAIEKGHPSFNPASSSPATDGERVVAYFGSFGLICFDRDGTKQWDLPMPLARTFGGNAASPAIFGDRVILYRATYVDHFLLAVDKRTGNQLWRIPQAEPFTGEMAGTACPIVAGKRLIVHTARSMQAFDITSGERIWVAKCATTGTSTPVLAGDEVLVAAWNKMGEPALRPAFPTFEELVAKHDRDADKTISRDELPTIWIFHRPDGAEAPLNGGTIRFRSADRDQSGEITRDEWAARVRDIDKFRAGYKTHGILAIPITSEGVVGDDGVRTLEKQGIPEVPSPLCDGTYVYFVKNGGVLTCLDLKTGKRMYRMRTRGRGTHYASPIIAGGKLYTVSGAGQITVLSLGPKPELLAVNEMGESVYATPAVVDDTLYVRTHSTLFAFRERDAD